jgi:hypothetical protein
MATYKYFGQYTDASYGSCGRDYLNGFTSLGDARQYFTSVQEGEARNVEFIENNNGAYVMWESGYSRFPATTNAGELYLCRGEKGGDGQYFVTDTPEYRLFVGERGGIKIERL